jgi:hypothetical protein
MRFIMLNFLIFAGAICDEEIKSGNLENVGLGD